MRSNKRYTNTTFTKRVDHEAGRHRPSRAPAAPRVCERCGAKYARRRWTNGAAIPKQREGPEPTRGRVLCPACVRIVSGSPCGYVRAEGRFLEAHRGEIAALLRTEAARAAQDNPLARVISRTPSSGAGIELTTTTPHLAQRLGHALHKAYGGHVHYDFSHENTVARVTWSRDDE
jgi:NMD protein affecting ribosome stability and mRNA decay